MSLPGKLSEDALVKEVLSPIQLTSGVAGTFADVDISGWERGLLIAKVGVWNDSDSTLVLTLKNSAATPTSDAVAGGTFTWTITAGDSDDDEVHVAELNFLELGLTKRYLGFAKTALNAGDTVLADVSLVLYNPTGLKSPSQDHTVYKG